MSTNSKGVLAVMQHHIEVAKLDRDGKRNADAYAVMDDVYRQSVEARATVERLAEAAGRLEVAANTVDFCYRNRPENFALALQDMRKDAAALRADLAAFRGEA